MFCRRPFAVIFSVNLLLLFIVTWHLQILVQHEQSSICIKEKPITSIDDELVIYVVTPTYSRATQKADLTRLAHTLTLVSSLHWIIVEDAARTTELVKKLLLKTDIQYTLLSSKTPDKYKLGSSDPQWRKPRGVFQRNRALEWLRLLKPINEASVVYFADDDNTYDLQLFEEMRFTNMVSVWPVGLVGGLLWEGPIVSNGKVVTWKTAWKPERPFPIDMAGFAVNLNLLLRNPDTKFSINVQRGYQESELLHKLVTLDQLEPKAANCTKVYVWHTRTEKPKFATNLKLQQLGIVDDDGMEV